MRGKYKLFLSILCFIEDYSNYRKAGEFCVCVSTGSMTILSAVLFSTFASRPSLLASAEYSLHPSNGLSFTQRRYNLAIIFSKRRKDTQEDYAIRTWIPSQMYRCHFVYPVMVPHNTMLKHHTYWMLEYQKFLPTHPVSTEGFTKSFCWFYNSRDVRKQFEIV